LSESCVRCPLSPLIACDFLLKSREGTRRDSKHTRVTLMRSTRWRSWLRHCATSRKVAGSIPDGVIGIVSVALWPWGRLSHLTEMSSWGVKAAGAYG
jgi:hypothetical protein